MNSPDGGPAFPIHPDMPCPPGQGIPPIGMTLLDYFAGQVVVAAITTYGDQWGDGEGVRRQIEWAAKNAYDVADAMLAEKQRRQST